MVLDFPWFALLLATLLSVNGLRKRSLSPSGAAAAFVVGFGMMSVKLRVFGVGLIVFYVAGSRATKVGKASKSNLEDTSDAAGYRTAFQVLCNSLPAFAAARIWSGMFVSTADVVLLPPTWVAYGVPFDNTKYCPISSSYGHGWSRTLILAALGQLACCMGDTLASELGILSKSPPLLITTFKRVPPGTNGAMSVLGTAASILGGGLIGLTFVIDLLAESSACRASVWDWAPGIIEWGLLAGGLGSLVDSFLGATVQETKYSNTLKKILTDQSEIGPDSQTKVISGRNWLNNNQVNLLSSTITAMIIAFIG